VRLLRKRPLTKASVVRHVHRGCGTDEEEESADENGDHGEGESGGQTRRCDRFGQLRINHSGLEHIVARLLRGDKSTARPLQVGS